MKMLHCMVFCLVIVAQSVLVGRVEAQDSLGMSRVSALDYWNSVEDIAIVGSIAYVTTGVTGLHVIDISEPSHPIVVNNIPVSGSSYYYCGMDVAGNRLYVSSWRGAAVFDISNPTNPVFLGEGGNPQGFEALSFCDIFVFEDYAIVEHNDGIPDISDVSDPNDIHPVGSFDPYWNTVINGPLGMVGDYLYMLGYGIFIWDVSNPAQPVIVDSLASPTLHEARRGVIHENYAYISSWNNGVRIVDLSDPLHPQEVGGFEVGFYQVDLCVSGEHLIANVSDSLTVWNIADPIHPYLESSVPLRSWITSCSSVASLANCVLVTEFFAGLGVSVVDISQPTAPVKIASIGRSGPLYRMTAEGTVGYTVTAMTPATIDLTDPANLSDLGMPSAVLPACNDIAVRGDYAYVPSEYYGMYVLDIGDPAHPESLSAFLEDSTWYVTSMERILISGDYAYVILDSAQTRRLFTLSLLDPVHPMRINALELPLYYEFGFAGGNECLYYGAGRDLYVYSLADPTDPQPAGSCNIYYPHPAHIRDLAVAEDYVYVAYDEGYLRMVSVSDPAHPVEDSGTIVAGYVSAVAVQGNVLFAYGYPRISVLDLSDPLNPPVIGYYEAENRINQMLIIDSYLFTVADRELVVYQCDALEAVDNPEVPVPNRIELHPCYPNPFNPTTTISFDLSHTIRARVTVYDVMGREVSTVVDEVMNAGEHTVEFDGSVLPSGIYFARLTVGSQMMTRKMVLLR
jgi:hypothetical protein